MKFSSSAVLLHLLLTANPSANTAFDAYIKTVEARLEQHRFPLAAPYTIELVPTPGLGFPGALLHHWRATAFAPGAKLADFEYLLRDVPSWPRYFAPQVLQAKILTESPNHLEATMRVRQHHVIAVTLDTAYDITFARLDDRHGYSISRSTRIAEADATEDHGYLWRLNTYWTYEQRPEGLVLRIETVSLTRSVPTGLGWLIGPYIQTIPRESLEFTLRSALNYLNHERIPQ